MDTGYFYGITPNQDNWELFFKVVFPVFTLLLGALIAFGFQRLAEFLRLDEIKKYLIHAIEDLKIAIDAQVAHLETFVSGIKEKNHDIPFLIIEPGFHTRSLETISRYDTFKIIILKGLFNKEQKRKVLNNYNNSIEIIKVIEQHSKDEIDALVKSDGQDKRTYNGYFWKLQDLINSKIQSYNEMIIADKIKEKEKIEEILSVMDVYTNLSTGSKTIFQHEDYLITPLSIIAKKYNDLELTSTLPQMIDLVNELKETRKAFAERFEMYKNNLNKSKIYLSDVIEIL